MFPSSETTFSHFPSDTLRSFSKVPKFFLPKVTSAEPFIRLTLTILWKFQVGIMADVSDLDEFDSCTPRLTLD